MKQAMKITTNPFKVMMSWEENQYFKKVCVSYFIVFSIFKGLIPIQLLFGRVRRRAEEPKQQMNEI